MTTLKITIAYKGTHFNGWQYQPKGRTVQGVLEKTISTCLGEPVKILGASRTDAGVHANGQVACVQYQCALPPENFMYVINRALPDDVVITEAKVVEASFHPIVDTYSKIYHYRVHHAHLRDPFKNDFSWHVPGKLNVNEMIRVSALFLGEHDFKSFCASGSKVKSTIRTIYSIEICHEGTHDLVFKYHGNGFLYNMIRIITAVLIRVGQGKLSYERVSQILKAQNRSLIPWTAPAQGLSLVEIFYEPQENIQK